jgi:hypothetical protein
MGRGRADNFDWARPVVVVVVVGVSLLALWRIVRGTQSGTHPNDFLTYRYAVNAARDGVNIYHHDITGPMLRLPNGARGQPFTYTPAAVVSLWPTTWFGWHTAWVLWDVAAMLVLGWVITRFVPAGLRFRESAIAAAIVVASFDCIVTHNIRQGQVNIFLMGLVLADLFRRDDTIFGRVVPRGVLVGVATAIKLTPGLFIVFFLITRQWRLVRGSAIGAVAATLVGALAYPDLTGTFASVTLWTLPSKVDTVGDRGDVGNDSINGALHASGSIGTAIALPVVLVSALVAMYAAYRVQLAGRSVDAWLIIGLAAPLISPFSWIYHHVYLIPALTLLAFDPTASRTARIRNLVLGVAASVALYWGPWGADRWLQGDHSTWLVLPIVLQRECALLASIACIVALCVRRPVRTRKIRVAPEVGQLATP